MIDTDLLLFASVFPSNIDPAAIYEFFNKAGPMNIFKLSKSEVGMDLQPVTSNNGLRRGFCILAPSTMSVYDRILSDGRITFIGRSLCVSPFKVGSSNTKQSDSQTSRKRFLLEKVPNIMSNELLFAYLSTSFGNITKMFRLQAESLKKTPKS